MRAVTAVVALLVSAAVASAAASDRSVRSPGAVLGLARSGFSVAFLSGPYQGHCGPHVELWNLVSRGRYRLGRHTDVVCREGPSTGSGVTDLAVAGNRVLWLSYAGGNNRDWQLWTATTTRPLERQLEFREVDVDAAPPIVVGVGSEFVLPYSVGSVVKVLAADGHRRYTWQAPGRVTNTTAYQSRVAVFVAGGRCFVLSPSGAVQRTYTFPVGAVKEFALSGVGLVVQLPGGKIEIRNGSSVRTFSIPAQGRMLDYAEGILLYKIGTAIRARRLSTGKDVVLRHGTFGQLEHNGFSYAVGRRVYSVAMVNVQAALNAH
ncbi:MAG TPA: hypothetical protein VJT84_07855 [Gaiellaceae bacterium]|nr:hypothetical protein [Gaiellaceae bacterium]